MKLFNKLTKASRIRNLVRKIKGIRPDLRGQSDHEAISTYLNDELIADYWQNVHYQKQLTRDSAPDVRPAARKPILSKLFEEALLLTSTESMMYYIKLTHQLLFDNQELRRNLARFEESESGKTSRSRFNQSCWRGQSEQYGQREG